MQLLLSLSTYSKKLKTHRVILQVSRLNIWALFLLALGLVRTSQNGALGKQVDVCFSSLSRIPALVVTVCDLH